MVDEKNPITPELEKQIQDYTEFLFNTGKVWNSENLEKEVFNYLDRAQSGTYVDKLSTRLAQIWAIYYRLGKFLEADKFWDLPLDLYTKWEKTNKWEEIKKKIARTTPYYFRGMSAIAYGNIDRGFLFSHQAFEGDLEEGFRPNKKGEGNHSPAWLFVAFGYSDPRQAAGQLLKRRADWLGQIISKYQNSNRGALSLESLSSSLSLESLGENALDETQLIETTFSFTYNVFRSENLLSYPEEFRSGRFASQLALDILFSLCRIGEVWIKTKYPLTHKNTPTLNPLLLWFFKHPNVNIKVAETELKNVREADFEKSLLSLLDDKKGSLPRRFQPVESDLLLIYILRNKAGHTPISSRVISERFNELVDRVFFGLFKIVETLY